VRIDAEAYQRALGEELRKVRKRRGWTRKELNERLQSEISLQTLATYELGTRQCSVVRLVELCIAMEETPQDLLARVHRRVFTDEPGRVRVALDAVIRDDQPELQPLRRWCQDRLRQAGGAQADVQLDRQALEWLAELCGMPVAELVSRLDNLASNKNQPT
jgi:transcriptional regulator with XRE-family HTH domain